MTPDAARAMASRTNRPAVHERLADGLRELGIAATEAQRDSLAGYLAMLARWNTVYNLTAIRNPDDMLAVHLFDSLAIASLVVEAPLGSVLDVGTGAGLPGIPLSIMIPERRFDLVDAVAKKIGFVRQVKSELGLANVSPHHQRIEVLTLVAKPAVIVSRAYAELGTMVTSVAHLAGPDALLVAMKGVVPEAEIAALDDAWKVVEVRELAVPALGARRCAVLIQRAR